MINDGGVSRTPRTWTEGSEEPPADVTLLRREDGYFARRVRGGRGWWFVADVHEQAPEGEDGWPWWNNRVWPLVEVLPGAPEPQLEKGCCGACRGEGGVMGDACSDCLGSGHTHDPDDPCRTPEPQCTCFTVPEERWTRHCDATEPGSMVEPNPDCPVHFPKAPQDDKVGTVRRLDNSWFVKLVEPRSEPWHVVCSNGQQNVSGWQSDEDMQDCPVVGYLPIVECFTPSEVEAARELYRGVARVHDDLRAQINAVLDHPVMPSSEKVGAISVILDAASEEQP